MSLISCPRCDETVRVPETISMATTTMDGSARCPWCRETFSVSEVIARLPPMLEVVSLEDSPLNDPSLNDPGIDTSVMDVAGEYQLSDPLQNTGPTIAPVARIAGASRGRAGDRKDSGIGAVIKVALGGLLAVPIAAAILSLVGKPLPIDLGFFPFQGDGGSDHSSSVVAAPPRPLTTSRGLPKSKRKKSRVLSVVVPDDEMAVASSGGQSEAEDALAKIRDADNSLETPGSIATPEVPVREITAPSMPVAEIAVPEAARPEISSMELPGLENAMEPKPGSVTAELRLPKLSANLTAAIADANAGLDGAVEILESGAMDTKAFGDAYRGIAEVGSLIDESSAASPEVGALLKHVASSPLAGMYSQVGRAWIVAKSRKTDGILLIGDTVDSDTGTLIDLGEGKTLAVKYNAKLPSGRVAALGRIQSGTDEPLVELSVVQAVQ